MPLSDSELKALKADAKRKVVSAGDSLFVVVESVGKGGGKSFIGRTRFPPGRSGKQVEVRIGPYGRGAGKWTLKSAREKWEGPTFQQLVDAYLAWGATKRPKPMKPRTAQDNRNKLLNQMKPELGADTPVKQLSWDGTGKDYRTSREVVRAPCGIYIDYIASLKYILG